MSAHQKISQSIMNKIPTSGIKANPDGNEYLSDVNTHNSDTNYRSDSEASADFIASARTLEHGFKYKFKILRQAYEDRLVNLSQIVETSCGALINEEIGHELRKDATTLGYLPSHLAEIFSGHLHDERELFLAETLKKLSALEIQAAKKNKIVDENLEKMTKLEAEVARCRHRELEMDPMRYRLSELEGQFLSLQREAKAESAELTQRNEALKQENHTLTSTVRDLQGLVQMHSSQQEAHHSDIQLTRNEFTDMEKHCHRLEREMSRLSEVDGENEGLRIKLRKYMQERDVLREEIAEYRQQLKQAADELNKCQITIDAHVRTEEANKMKIANLMSQVDIVISQEANESTAAIEAAHSKMKAMRQNFIAELQEERKVTVSLESQLVAARDELQSRDRAIKAYEADLNDLKVRLEESRERENNLEKINTSLLNEDRHLKSVSAEYRLRSESLEIRLHELERTKAQEISQISDQIRAQIQRQYEIEKGQLDMRTSTLRMQFENELSAMQAHFKKSRDVFETLSGGADRSPHGENLHYLANLENNDLSQIGVSKLLEEQQAKAMEVIAALTHWQGVAGDVSAENQVFRQSIEKAGDNIRILRNMLDVERQRTRELQDRLVEKEKNHSTGTDELVILRQRLLELQHTVAELQFSSNAKDAVIRSFEPSHTAQVQHQHNKHLNSMQNTSLNNSYTSIAASNSTVQDDLLRRENEKLQSMYISMQRALTEKESTIHILEQSLNDARNSEQTALESSANFSQNATVIQMQALNDMKKRFQGLIETYEQSNTELEDELKIKIGHSSALQIENEELSSQLSSVQHSLHRVTGECSTYKQQAYSRQQAVLHLKQVIGRLESKIKIEVAQIKRTSLDVSELMKLLIHNTASESSKAKALVADAVKSAFLSIDGDRLIAVQEVQRALIKEHRQHEEAMSQAFTTEMWKKTAEYSETIERTKSELISHFDQAMMFGQYEDKSGFHSSLSTSERAHFALVLSIKAILDSLVSVSLIDADFVNEVMQLISSNSTVDGESDFNSISAGLLATKLHKILKIKLDESLQLRDTDGAVSSSLKNEVNSLRIQVDKGNNQIRELTKENASLTSQVGSTLTTLTKLNKDITTIKELHAIETETLSQEMRDKLYSAQREYDNSIQNLRIDFIQKEADLKLRLDEAHSSVRSTNETTFLEARLKSEVTKRQSLANRLSAEEAAHRSIVQELEDRNMQLLRKVEALELDMTKLKLEKLHQFGEEFMASTIMHVNHTTTSSNTNNSNIISSSSSSNR